jgi:uncharacterized membrane protein YheB (UPF0754 family)
MEFLQQSLPYLAPPLLGALIGYVTNYIAIRMLFRPLRPWHLCGVRLPLTPGIIPAKREELAARIGEMVGSHLVTSDEVAGALERPGFQQEMRQAVCARLGDFLDRELDAPASLVPDKLRGRFREMVEGLQWKAVREVFAYLESPAFEERLQAFLQRKGDELLARDPAGLLSLARRADLERQLRSRVSGWLRSANMARAIARLADEQLDELLASERPLRELLPRELSESAQIWIEGQLPPLLERLVALLQEPEVRERLVVRAQQAVEGFLESLGGLSGLLSGFLGPDKIAQYLPGLLDRAGEEIGRCLAEEGARRRVATLVVERLDGLLERSPADLLAGVPYGRMARLRRFVRARVTLLVRGDNAGRAIDALLSALLDRLRTRSCGELLEEMLPEGGVTRARAALAAKLLDLLRSPAARETVSSELAALAEKWLFERPLGRLSARLTSEVRCELEDGLHAQLMQLLVREVPPLVDSLDVRRMVEDKVNSLDILKVEGLLLGIMQEQFKYINLFGALLGALIGLVNLLLLGVM